MPGLKKIKNIFTIKAVEILKAGGVVVFPTETAYGLAADATNEKAVRRVFAIKGRGKEKSFPLIAADFKMVEKYAVLSPVIKKLVKKYWPGALTVVVPVQTIVGNKNFCSLRNGTIRSGTIAIRVPDHPIACELSKRLGRPIVSTSANVSGEPVCYSVRVVKKQFVGQKTQPDFYLDVGRLKKIKPSTIIMEKEGEIIVLRQGEIKI
ncbi:MAG: L-threonylcarbamoyladenylate synthase [Candidatus Uhrbacteria bacterium]